MSRRVLLSLVGGVVALALLLTLSPASANVSNLRLTTATCSGVTVTVYYDNVVGGTAPNRLRFTAARVTAGGDVQLAQLLVNAPAAAQDVIAALGWVTEPTGQTIRVTVDQIDSAASPLVISSVSVAYACGASGGTPIGGTATPTPTQTPVPASQLESAAGVSRLYDDLLTAVVFRMANGDVQFYHIRGGEGVFVGNVPAAQMNPALYQPGQRVGQFTSPITSWRVDFYYHGWDAWHAVYFDNTGAQRADAWFHYGDPGAGRPPNEQPQAQPGQPGVIPTVAAGQVVIPFPTLFPRGIPTPTLPAIVQMGQPIAVPLVGTLTAYARVPLSVRVGPSTATRRVTVIPAGMAVSLSARDASGQWALGVLPNGQYGWMATRYLSVNLAQVLGLPVASG